jgi:hypothetical protein
MDDTARAGRELEKRLAKHPGLRAQVERLLEEVENRGGELNTADEAEDAVVARVRELGRMALQRWAEERARAVQPPPQPGLRRGGKKNSAG